MQADDANLLELLKKGTQFEVPIYQRIYSWDIPECERLWDDILRAGNDPSDASHFTGSIVYVEKDQGTRTSAEPDLIIDGQQRVTTVTLLLSALAQHLADLPPEDQEPVDGFSPIKIRGRYLTNSDEDGERHFKLLLSQTDREALKKVVLGVPLDEDSESRVNTNFHWFQERIASTDTDLTTVCIGIRKLQVVDVKLARDKDNPQLVFEAMNSTGKKLSQADLIRNFVLMDLPQDEQRVLYEGYWFPMEQEFKGANENRFDGFVRNYLTHKTGVLPRVGDVYEAFKGYSQAFDGSRGDLVRELRQYSTWFAAMAMGKEQDPELGAWFDEIEQLNASIVYPYLLRLYSDYDNQVLAKSDFLQILHTIESFWVRRMVCRINTNVLNRTFATLGKSIDIDNYLESVNARFLTLTSNQRFPSDEEFIEVLKVGDFYNLQRATYLLGKIENQNRKEPVSVANFSIEHIMPQNPNLPPEWQSSLGDDWQETQERLLHTLGNLTLTGYNPEYSDKPFQEKRDMHGGFKQSPLYLNQGLGDLDIWNEDEIVLRATRLAQLAIEIWPRPKVRKDTLAEYRARFTENSGFDWTMLHEILKQVPAGKWVSYNRLGTAVGTSPQAVAGHLSRCPICVNPYRVMTWEGKISEGFSWNDPSDERDPRTLLNDEGVRFDNGLADPEQLLTSDALLALVDE